MLSEIADLHYVAVFPRDVCRFAVILFFPTDQALMAAKADRLETVASEVIESAVNKFRAVKCSELEILVELDSYENVKRNFGGSYFNRLR
jgi:hypothetical protein